MIEAEKASLGIESTELCTERERWEGEWNAGQGRDWGKGEGWGWD